VPGIKKVENHWHRITSKFTQSVLPLVSPVTSVDITHNKIIYITPTMILYEDMKPVIIKKRNRLDTFDFIRYAYFLTWCAHANTVI